jgi:hypothetical protein
MFFVPPLFMVRALSHFLWHDSRDPVAGVAYEAPKVSGQPAPRLVEASAGVHVPEPHHQNFTSTHKPFRRYWLPSLNRKLLPKNSDNKTSVLGRETAMIQLSTSKHHHTARPRSSSAVATTPHQSWDSTLPVVSTTRLNAATSMTAEQKLSSAACSAKRPLR